MTVGMTMPRSWLSMPSKTMVRATRATSHFWYAVQRPWSSRWPTSTGTRVHRFTGSQVHRFTGSQVHGFTGSRVHGFTGSRVHRFTGSQGSQVHGSRVHGFTGSLNTCFRTSVGLSKSRRYPSGSVSEVTHRLLPTNGLDAVEATRQGLVIDRDGVGAHEADRHSLTERPGRSSALASVLPVLLKHAQPRHPAGASTSGCVPREPSSSTS